jgi:hypothetical protein
MCRCRRTNTAICSGTRTSVLRSPDQNRNWATSPEIVQEKGGKEKRLRDFVIPVGAQLTVDDGEKISAGTILAKIGK